MKYMVSTARTSPKKLTWIHDTLWKEMIVFWDTNACMAKSSTTSTTRLSDRKGLGVHKRNSGHKFYMQIEQKMVSLDCLVISM